MIAVLGSLSSLGSLTVESQLASSAPLSLLAPVDATPMNTPAFDCEEAGA